SPGLGSGAVHLLHEAIDSSQLDRGGADDKNLKRRHLLYTRHLNDGTKGIDHGLHVPGTRHFREIIRLDHLLFVLLPLGPTVGGNEYGVAGDGAPEGSGLESGDLQSVLKRDVVDINGDGARRVVRIEQHADLSLAGYGFIYGAAAIGQLESDAGIVRRMQFD